VVVEAAVAVEVEEAAAAAAAAVEGVDVVARDVLQAILRDILRSEVCSRPIAIVRLGRKEALLPSPRSFCREQAVSNGGTSDLLVGSKSGVVSVPEHERQLS
jgi:hypothetical protein